MALERHEQALELALLEVERLAESDGRSHSLHRMELVVARLWALTGEAEKGAKMLPSFSLIRQTAAYYPEALRTVATLIDHGGLENTWQLGATMWGMVERLGENGAFRHAVEGAHTTLRLAVARGSRSVSELVWGQMQPWLGQLHMPYDLGALGPLLGEMEGLSPPVAEPWESVEELSAQLGEDPERDLERLSQAVERWPEEDELWLLCSDAWEVLGFRGQRLEALHRGHEATRSARMFHALSRALYDLGEFERLDPLLKKALEGPHRFDALLMQALGEEAKGADQRRDRHP